MSNVHVLPTNPGAAAARRLSEELAAALNCGADLGSRVPHMRKQVQLLHYQGQLIRSKIDEIASASDFEFPRKQELLGQFEEIIQLVDKLSAATRQMLL